MTTTTYPNTAAGYAQAVADHGEANLLVDPFTRTIVVKPAEAVAADRYVTSEQFRDRFTEAELLAISADGQTDAMVAFFLAKLGTASGPFSLDREDVIDGLNYLVSKGLIAANRPDKIRE